GLAALKKASGAKLYISKEDTDIMERGGKDDYLLGNSGLFPAVSVDRSIEDGEVVSLGETRLTARVTAGHTQGCTTWTLQVEDAGAMLDVVIVCSVTVLSDVSLITEPSYPGIADDFHKTFDVLESLPCDVFLASHGQFFDLENKTKQLKEGAGVNPFIDPDRYTAYVAKGKKRFLDRLAKEKAEG
ncbi:MAG: subclass B3 metallo-beta-lactamase, partial [Rhodothermales bacterium]